MAIVFGLLSLFLPALSHASEVCPWLNAATAAGFLEGPVTATVTHPSPNKYDAACEFVRREPHLVSSLRIDVETMKDPARDFASYKSRCTPDAMPLQGHRE
jgi:hypothetical protein